MGRPQWNRQAEPEPVGSPIKAARGFSVDEAVPETGPSTSPASASLGAAQFAREFQDAYRLLWLVAAGIVADASAADDVVQEAALLGLGKLSQFQPGTNFRAWMAQMVRFVALNHARKHHKRRAAQLDTSSGDSGMPIPAPAPQSHLQLTGKGHLPPDQHIFDDEVVAALNSVPDIARSCLLLRSIEHLEYSEISRLLNIPEGTAMSHVHRTRQYLRERLSNLAPPSAGTGGAP